MRAALDLGGQRKHIKRAQILRDLRLQHADEARAETGEGHQRERPGLRVELGRDSIVWARMRKIQRQRGLWVFVPLGFDTGGLTAERLAAVRANNQPRVK